MPPLPRSVPRARAVKYDFVYLPRALNVSVLKLAVVGSPDGSRRESFVSWLTQTYPGLSDPSGALLGPSGLGCAGLAFDVEQQGSLADFPPIAPYISTFDTEAAMEAFINSDSYGSSPATAGLWAAVVFPDVAGGAEARGAVVRYTLRANASDVFDTHTLTAGLSRGVNLGVLGNLSYSSAYSYGTAGSGPLLAPLHQPGFLALQLAVDKFIIAGGTPSAAPFAAEVEDLLAFAADWGCVNISSLAVPDSPATTAINKLLTSHAYAPQHSSFVAFPISSYKNDDFYTFVGNVFALIFVLSFFFPSFFLIRGLVVEKETRIREGMRMMGLADAVRAAPAAAPSPRAHLPRAPTSLLRPLSPLPRRPCSPPGT